MYGIYSLHILIHIGTMKFNYIYAFLAYNVSLTNLTETFFSIALICHHTKSFCPRNLFSSLVSNYCPSGRYTGNIAQNDDMYILTDVYLRHQHVNSPTYQFASDL